MFALIVTGLMLAGALAFDVGLVMLERRDQQNAADAAALAGARELPNAATARRRPDPIATANGFTQAVDSATVSVGATSTRIVVTITRPVASYFANLVGIANFNVSSTAVAVSLQDQPPFAALTALNPHACGALSITGSGVINSWGDVQVNSDCPTHALQISGQGNLQLNHDGLGCWVVGGFQISGKGQGLYCDPPQPGVPLPFPVNDMPSNTATPATPLQVAGATKAIPERLPRHCRLLGYEPKTCQFPSNYNGTSLAPVPGLLPGRHQAASRHVLPGARDLSPCWRRLRVSSDRRQRDFGCTRAERRWAVACCSSTRRTPGRERLDQHRRQQQQLQPVAAGRL